MKLRLTTLVVLCSILVGCDQIPTLNKEEIANLESNYYLSRRDRDDEIIVGQYGFRNVVARFACSDLCLGGADDTFIVYESVGEFECRVIGGRIVAIHGWGRIYVGCSPLARTI